MVKTAGLRYSFGLHYKFLSAKNEYLLWDSLLDQKNAIKDDYILMENQLQSIKEQFHSSQENMSGSDFDKVSHTIEELEAFLKLIQMEIQNRIYKMKRQGSHIKAIEMNGIGKKGSLNKKEPTPSPSSETDFLLIDLGSDLVEHIYQKFWDGWLDNLSGILHGIPLRRDNDQKIIKEGNELSLQLQNLLFQQVGYIYRQKMISEEAFKNFCQLTTTLEIAALNMIHNCRSFFGGYNPVTVLNQWYSEDYRNIYEGKYEESILINTNHTLNVPDI